MERTAHDPIPGAPCKPSKIKALRRFDSTFRIGFRVKLVTTTSIPLQIVIHMDPDQPELATGVRFTYQALPYQRHIR